MFFKSLIYSISVLTIMSSCTKNDCVSGNGSITEETRIVNNVDGIDLKLPAEVFIHQGVSNEVVLKSSSNILSLVETSMSGNTLVVSQEDNTCLENYSLEIHLTIETFNKAEIIGTGKITVNGPISGTNVITNIEGSGDIMLNDISADHFSATIIGSGNINLSGSDTLITNSLRIDGSGFISTIEKPSLASSVVIYGSGTTEVHAINNLNVEIDGSGLVLYKGSPSIDSDIKGSGEVRPK